MNDGSTSGFCGVDGNYHYPDGSSRKPVFNPSSGYLLVAIDGTLSSGLAYTGDQNESFVRKFHRTLSIPESQKYFAHGPEEAATGWDAGKIADAAWAWLRGWLGRLPHARVILVGHSRGGHVVNYLAIQLSKVKEGGFVQSLRAPGPLSMAEIDAERSKPAQMVYFMGLYDAVDMTTSLGDTSTVPANVEWCFHAVRGKRTGSRSQWGNTATKFAVENKIQRIVVEYEARHGSMGGSIPEACPGNLAEVQLVGGAAGYLVGSVGGPGLGMVVGGVGSSLLVMASPEDACAIPLTAAESALAGKQAHGDLIAHAQLARIPIPKP